jgi:hypothetical protein
MKAITLILVAGVALAGFACVPQRAPPPAPPPFVAQVCTPSGALNPVPFLAGSFTPVPPFDQSPQPDTAPVNPEIQSDLVEAFNAAPPFFKDQLCKLDGIFINRAGCSGNEPNTCNLSDNQIAENSWGFRKYPTGERYIAVSLGLWNYRPCQLPRTVCAPPFQAYQMKLTQAVLKTLSPTPLPIQFVNVSPNTVAMSVLAALAHEFGHVYWYDSFVIDPNTGAPNPGGPAVTTRFCGGNFYPPGSWPYPVDVPPGRWLRFGEIRDQALPSEVLQLPGLLSPAHFPEAAVHLHNIYSNGRWASALAALSPDEEFVETFELFVLRNASPPLASLQVRINNLRPDPIPHPPKTVCFQQQLCPNCSL